ncbi:hypothetical protein [Pseudomonas phage D6]|nr:hypothetical protein [Pseudomonas phage D6]
MGIRKRLLEGKLAWLNRVMHLHDVHFAYATDANQKRWLVFVEADNDNRVGLHRIGEGPEVGRMVLTEDRDVDNYTFEFCTRNGSTHVRHLKHHPDKNSLVSFMAANIAIVRQLAPHEGIHIYTDDNGVKWYVACDSSRGPRLSLYTNKDSVGVRRVGWFMFGLLDQYGGEWFLDNLSYKNREVIDPTMATTDVSNTVISKELRDRYTLVEADKDDTVIVLGAQVDGLADKRSYRLSIDLSGMVADNQVLNIYYLLQKIVNAEFRGRAVLIDLDRIDFIIDGERNHGMVMHGTYGNQYFFHFPNGAKSANFQIRDNGLFPRTFA